MNTMYICDQVRADAAHVSRVARHVTINISTSNNNNNNNNEKKSDKKEEEDEEEEEEEEEEEDLSFAEKIIDVVESLGGWDSLGFDTSMAFNTIIIINIIIIIIIINADVESYSLHLYQL